MSTTAIALVLSALGLVGVLLGSTAAARLNPRGDAGPTWASAALWLAWLLLLGLIASQIARIFLPDVWLQGWHLYSDQLGAGVGPLPLLLLPFVLLAALGAVATLQTRRMSREEARWMVGSVGFAERRYWALAPAGALAAVALVSWSQLDNAASYPAAVWGSLAAVTLALLGLALSQESTPPEELPEALEEAKPAPQRRDWVSVMRAHGVRLETVATVPAPPRRAQREPLERSRALDLSPEARASIDPTLVSAVEALIFGAASSARRRRLCLAPDDAGQLDLLAAAARAVARDFRETTLVIVPGQAEVLGEALKRAALEPAGLPLCIGALPERGAPGLAIMDSEQLARHLQKVSPENPTLLTQLGLLVWWDVQDYTGVLAANTWALSRRLDRVLEAPRHEDIPVLLMGRTPADGGAQLTRFIQDLLPYAIEDSERLELRTRVARRLHVHLLDQEQPPLKSPSGRGALSAGLPNEVRHPVVLATLASASTGWRTHALPSPELSSREWSVATEQLVGDAPLGALLVARPTHAEARVIELTEADVFALPERIAMTGRALPEDAECHVAVLPPRNPYALYCLRRMGPKLAKGELPSQARTLVGAKGSGSTITRHVLAALRERKDTHVGLRATFGWAEAAISQALDQLDLSNELRREEVRFLLDGKLLREPLYESDGVKDVMPSDTVGLALVDVRHNAAQKDAVRMRVDPERVNIQAYPGAVFMSGQARYVVDKRSHEAKGGDSVGCAPHDPRERTLRICRPSIESITVGDQGASVGRGGLLHVAPTEVRYQERLRGYLLLRENEDTGQTKISPVKQSNLWTSFNTRGLLIRFSARNHAQMDMASVAAALRWSVPVHVGVSRQAMEVVPVNPQALQPDRSGSRAAVLLADLYPNGVGLVDAFGEDERLLIRILMGTREWLAACPCSTDGCASCLKPPEWEALKDLGTPSRKAALDVLNPTCDSLEA
jgi:hypothetical protein